jgi:hypothetical protein
VTPLIASIVLMFAHVWLPAGEAAEVLRVEGLGPTSLRGFDCVAIARSALVSNVCHDAAGERAIAVIAGRARIYCGVSRERFDDWLAAPSMGRFHAERIEPSHRCDERASAEPDRTDGRGTRAVLPLAPPEGMPRR